MINVYKAGGIYTNADGTEYSIKTINESDKAKLIKSGWVASLDKVKPPRPRKKTVKVSG